MLRSTLTSTLRSVQPARLFTNTAIPKMPYTQSAKLPESHSKFANDGEPKLHLLTKGTPNGLKVHALLEELREAYPQNAKLAYDFVDIQFDKKEQKSPEFLEVNPNGRIPALVDDNVKDPATGKGHNVFESASILIWLVENYDTENKFWFKDPILRSKAISWIFFGHGGEFVDRPVSCILSILRLTPRCRTHARSSQPLLVSTPLPLVCCRPFADQQPLRT